MAIDLDQQKAARNEGKDEHPKIVFGGREWPLPVELPIELGDHIRGLTAAAKDKNSELITKYFRAIAESLLVDQYEEFMKLRPSAPDMSAIVEGIVTEYGVTTGESSASETS